MIVYRCTLRKWSKDLDGKGAFLYGGRWNSPGVYMVYTAENNVLAAFEVALRISLELISKDYVMIPIEIPDSFTYLQPKLPKNWYSKQETTRSIGDNFVKQGRSLLMKVPSALISDSYNILINPLHEGIRKVKVHEPRPILFDSRLHEMIRAKEEKSK